VFRVLEDFQKILLPPGPSTIFLRTGSDAFEAYRRLVLPGLQDLLHRQHVFPPAQESLDSYAR
jgi:hypothetical protein